MPLVIDHGGSLSVKLMQLQAHNPANMRPLESDSTYPSTIYISYYYMNNLSRCPLRLDKLFDFEEVEIYIIYHDAHWDLI